MNRLLATNRRDERGAGSIYGLTMAALLVWLGGAFGLIGATVVDHRQAQSAADLAAVGGAAARQQGEDPCRVAGEIAERNQARVVRCTVHGDDVRLRVEVTPPAAVARFVEVDAEAWAGPVASSGHDG